MIEVVVGSNVSQATAGIEKFKNSLNTLPAAMTPLSGGIQILNNQIERLHRIASSGNLSFKQFERVNVLIASTRAEMAKLNAAAAAAAPGFNKLGIASNSANFALLNTGRVIQDLPFGFLGIANNLNPLLESFQRLKAESGSSRIALQQLGKSFLGAGGLGFALSLASSAMILLTSGFQSFSRKTKEAKEDVDRLAEVLKSIGSAAGKVEIIAAGTTEETSKVIALSNAVLDQTKSYAQRNNAINQLKEINKSYFGDLTLESDKLAILRGRVEEYTSALIAAATVRAFADDIGKLNVEFAKQLIVFNKAGSTLDEYKRKLAGTKEAETSLTGEDRISRAFVKAKKDVDNASAAYSKQVGVMGELRGKILEFRGALQGAVDESLKFDPLKEIKQSDTKSLDDFIDKTIARARQFASEFGEAFVVPDLSDSFLKTKDQIFKASKQLLEDVKNLNLKVRVPVDIDFDFIPQEVGPPLARLGKDLEEAMRAITGIKLEPLKIDFTLEAGIEAVKFREKMIGIGKGIFSGFGDAVGDFFGQQFADAVQKGMDKGLTQLKAISFASIDFGIKKISINAITSSMEELIDAIGRGENALASFGQFVKGVFKGVVAQILKAAAAAAVLSLFTGGANKGGLSFITALGSIFGGKGFAKGGIVPSGYPNDSYPALLSSHEVVLNPQQISSLMSSRTTSEPIVMAVEWSGDIMRLVQRRSQKRAGRSYG